MKKSDKYVKTRGQRIAFQQSHPQSTPKLHTSKPQKQISPQTDHINVKNETIKRGRKLGHKKSKKIVKIQTAKQKLKKQKQTQQKIIKKYKVQTGKDKYINNVQKKRGRKSKLVKQQGELKLEGKQPIERKQPANQKPQITKNFKIKVGGNTEKSSEFVSKTRGQKPSVPKEESRSKTIQTKPGIKGCQNIKADQKGSKSKITIANQDSPSPLNQNSIKLEPQAPIKKKGRPRKIIESQVGSKMEDRTLEEEKNLEQFVQSAIKLRKLKNEREFFECFSRIIEYMRQSWEYGELSKMLKKLPQAEDVLKVGIQITRGIRKQLHAQALAQTV